MSDWPGASPDDLDDIEEIDLDDPAVVDRVAEAIDAANRATWAGLDALGPFCFRTEPLISPRRTTTMNEDADRAVLEYVANRLDDIRRLDAAAAYRREVATDEIYTAPHVREMFDREADQLQTQADEAREALRVEVAGNDALMARARALLRERDAEERQADLDARAAGIARIQQAINGSGGVSRVGETPAR